MTQNPAAPVQHFTIGSVEVTIANGSEVSVRPARPGNPRGEGRDAVDAAVGKGRGPDREAALGAPIAAAVALAALPLRLLATVLGGPQG